MPARGRDQPRNYKGDDGYRKEETPYPKDYRKENYRAKDGSYGKDEPYRRDDSHMKDSDNYRKGESYRKGDSYRKDGGYRKSDSYRKEESFRKAEPRHRSSSGSGGRDYHREHSGHRKHESYRRDGDRPTYRKEESSYHKEDPSNKKDDSGYNREHREDGHYKKKPIQNLYDDWSPEDDKPSYRDKEERADPESDSEEDEESDYSDRDEEPPQDYKEKDPRKPIPASLRPGPPYYSPSFKRPAENKGHTSGFASRQDHPPTPTPQTFYAPSTKSNEPSKQFQHRKGELTSTKHPSQEKGWSDFRPSPPDPVQNSRSRMRDDYPESEYSSTVAKKAKVPTTPLPINRQNCVKLKKVENPPTANGKFVKNMMACYVCVDEKTGSNYEQCSYESDSKTRPYLKTTGTEEASHSKISHREKRDLFTYERVKREKDYYDSVKEKPAYKFDSDSFDDKEDLSDVSDKEEDDGSVDYDSDDNCYKKKKGEMSCIVCESPNKQGSYEQCSYESDPKRNKYEHSVEKVYGSPRLPESDAKFNKGPSYSKSEDYDSSVEIPSSDYEPPGRSRGESKSNRKLLGGGSFGFGLDTFDFGDLGGGKSSKSFDFGDSFDFDSIPEPAENEGQFLPQDDTFNFKSDEMADIDMTKDIGSFDQKNRSDCKKIVKNKMTCYQCVGVKGTKQEECMYVAAAEPKKKHLSFSQVQEYRFDPHNATGVGIEYPSFSYGKRKLKKYHPDLTDMKFFNKLKEKATMEASRWPRSPNNSTNSTKLKTEDQDGAASSQEYKQEEEDDGEEGEDEASEEEEGEDSEETHKEDYNAVPTDPPEIDYKEAERGEFHKETESAWDPKLGISLPRYMLEKSEHESVFDEVLASG